MSWFDWLLVVLWVTALLPLILLELDNITWTLGGNTVSVRSSLEAIVTAVAVKMLALWVSAGLKAKLVQAEGDNLSLRKMAANVLRTVYCILRPACDVGAAGLDLCAVGCGHQPDGAQCRGWCFGRRHRPGLAEAGGQLAANYVIEFVILAERSMRMSDSLKVDNFEGRIFDISTRYTVIRALNDREAIVPNEMMITQRVENASLADTRMLISTAVQVVCGTSLDALIPRLRDAVSVVPRGLARHPPGVLGLI